MIIADTCWIHGSGEIIATSHDLGPQNVAEEGKSPFFQKKSRLAKHYALDAWISVMIPGKIPFLQLD